MRAYTEAPRTAGKRGKAAYPSSAGMEKEAENVSVSTSIMFWHLKTV